MRITSGIGNGVEAGVDHNNRLMTESSTRSAQARVSIEDGKAFQVESAQVAVGTSKQTVLLLKNNSKSEKMIITYMRVMSAGVAAWNAAAFFSIHLGGDYVSGGTAVTPINVNTASGNEPLDMVYYDGTVAVVTSGTLDQIDMHHCANEMATYSKEGSVVIAPGGMLTIQHIGSTVAGTAYARVSFYLTENGGS